MRTLLHVFSSLEFGGSQSRFVRLANYFGSRYRHLLIAMDGNHQAAERLAVGTSFEVLPFATRRGAGTMNLAGCSSVLRAIRPDLLLTYNWGAIEWTLANWIPRIAAHVHVEDGFGPAERQRQLLRRVWMRRWLLGPAGHATLVVPSRQLAAAACAWWVPRKRLVYIPNGVALPETVPHRPKRPHGAAPVVGTVAGLRPEKNIGRLIKAFAQLTPGLASQLLIVGDGPDRQRLEALSSSLGVADRVAFTGYLRDPGVAMTRMDLFALPSDTEQQPISMMEAIAAGLPVCATAVGDVKDILPVQLHDWVAAPDDASFGSALRASLQGTEAWPERAATAFDALKQRYSEASMIDRWRRVFDGVSDDEKQPPLDRPFG